VQPDRPTVTVSMTSLWAGRILSALMVAFFFLDGALKVMKLAPAIEGTVRLGYPASLVFAIGLVDLVCVAAYAIPRTSVLGAILLTGYLGGATATQVRVENPWFLFPAGLGILVWTGLFLRDGRLRSLIPLRD
jgi:hypothetical protein